MGLWSILDPNPNLEPGLVLELVLVLGGISGAVSLEIPYTRTQDPDALAKRGILPWAWAPDSYKAIHRKSAGTSEKTYLTDIAVAVADAVA